MTTEIKTEQPKQILSFEDSIKILQTIKSTILEKALEELNKPLKFIYTQEIKVFRTHQVKGYSVNLDTMKTTITFRRGYLEQQFIKIVGLSTENFNKILLAIREKELTQEFNIWFKETLKLNKDSLL